MGAGNLEMDDPGMVFAELADRIPIGVNLIRWEDPEDVGSFRFIWVNEAAKRISGGGEGGFSYEVFLGRTLGESFPELMEGPLPGIYVAAVETGVPQRVGRLPVPNPSGRDAYFDLQAVRVGERLLAVTYVNITDQVDAEARRDVAIAELARSNEDLNDFAYVASHDMKAPLRDVDNLAQWIIEDLGQDAPDEVTEHAETLRSRVLRMERLLDDLLQYARAGQETPASSEFSLGELLAQLTEVVGAPEGFQIRLPQTNGLRLLTPRAPLEVVLRNLVGNAIKHHDRDTGVVRILVEETDAETVAFTVTDDGPGIPQEFHSRIFEMFKTLRSRDQVEGTGMGLALVQKLVHRYGGELTVESPCEIRGTSFRFTWPRVHVPAHQLEARRGND